MPINDPATALIFNFDHLSEDQFLHEINNLRLARALALSEWNKKKKAKKPKKDPLDIVHKRRNTLQPEGRKENILSNLLAVGMTLTPEQIALLTKKGRIRVRAEADRDPNSTKRRRGGVVVYEDKKTS